MAAAAGADDILSFWFGELDANGMPAGDQGKLWFGYEAATDERIRARFGGAVSAALRGELDDWAGSDEGLVALVILLDQFTRNIFRGEAAAFSGDPAALALSRAALASGRDSRLPTIHRVFLYIPFEHSESLADQDAGIACFDRLLPDCDAGIKAEISRFRDYMVAHRDIIARFGRFPHRNATLGRVSSAEEQAHLARHGGF